jgi:exonuclease III
MFNQIIQQNTMILNMLSALLIKFHKAKFIKIALWNANSLVQHKAEIKTFLDHNARELLLVSETHFTERTYFKLPNYNAHFTSHPDNSAHAGSGILIKNSISHYELPKYRKIFL